VLSVDSGFVQFTVAQSAFSRSGSALNARALAISKSLKASSILAPRVSDRDRDRRCFRDRHSHNWALIVAILRYPLFLGILLVTHAEHSWYMLAFWAFIGD
jgi:hypothetical protein